MKRLIKLKQFIILAGDITVLYSSLYLTLLIRYWSKPSEDLWNNHFLPFTIIFIGWILIFYIAGLYNLHLAINNAKFLQLTSKSLAVAGFLSIAFFYLTPQSQLFGIAPKRNLLIYIVIFAVLFFIWRYFFNWSLKSYLPKKIIAIIGFNDQVKELMREIKQKPHLGYKIAFILGEEEGEIDNIPIIKNISNLNHLILKNKVSTIILASDPRQSNELRSSLFESLHLKINYLSLSNFYETVAGKILLNSVSKMWFLENLSEGNKKWFNVVKRTYDIVMSLLILIITIPFWIIIGILLKIENKESVFFTQTRAGKNNNLFKMIKFRSQKTIDKNPAPTQENDPRSTKFGSFIRKTRIDEIPQVINILRGEMSFVGPRPERPELIKELEKDIPFYNERMLVKPGATGWDQISGEYHSPSQEDTLKKLQYDLFYIKNRSIYLDLSIILKTIATIFSKTGI